MKPYTFRMAFLGLGLSFILGQPTSAQPYIIYSTDMGDIPSWNINSAQIYASSETPSDYPDASGGDNLRFDDCQPVGEFRSAFTPYTFSWGLTGLTLSFGARRSDSWTANVSVDWSIDEGVSWTNLTPSLGLSTSWSQYVFSLPPETDDQFDLRIRWSFVTTSNGGCGVTRNFRIDDVLILAAALPIELSFFEARAEQGKAVLTWRTESEQNNDYMAVERSADARQWQEIGRLPGAGTTQSPQEYRYLDEHPLPGLSHYRLRQVDFDGSVYYHKVVSLRFEGQESGLALWPVPAQDELHLRLEAPLLKAHQLKISSVTGQPLLQTEWPVGERELRLDLADLSAGYYVLQLLGPQPIVEAFVKH